MQKTIWMVQRKEKLDAKEDSEWIDMVDFNEYENAKSWLKKYIRGNGWRQEDFRIVKRKISD